MRPVRAASAGCATLSIEADGAIVASGANPESDVYTLELESDLALVSGLKLDVELGAHPDGPGPGRSSGGNFVLSEIEIQAGASGAKKLAGAMVSFSSASFEQNGFPISGAHDGVAATGWAIGPQVGKAHTAVLELAGDVRGETGTRWLVTLRFGFGQQHVFERFRLSATDSARPVRLISEQDAWSGMQARIDQAIDHGVDYLIATQELDGSWRHSIGEYRNGQTALSLYALLKSGVSAKSPAVRRALEFLRCKLPGETYAAGLQSLAISALGTDTEEVLIENIADELLAWQQDGFAYPSGEPDISNTQYGALGLWVAAKHGVSIPLKAWQNLANFALACQEKALGAYAPAGFIYRAGSPVSGSRTAAGLTVLAICKQHLPEHDPLHRACSAAMSHGVAWLAKNFSSSTDPLANSQTWVYYWLYGCERVGAFTGLAKFGAHDWYREGARFLVDAQEKSGMWSNQPDTCFALLFLNRATAPSTGEARGRASRTYGEDSVGKDVSLRAAGDTPLNVWISSFGERVLRKYGWPADGGKGPRVVRVDYLAPDQALIADARSGSIDWRMASKAPPEGWNKPDYDDSRWNEVRGAFGQLATSDQSVKTPWSQTEWSKGNLWLRTALELEPADLVDPQLVLRFAPALDPASTGMNRPPLVCLFDESKSFVEALSQAGEGSTATLTLGDAQHGNAVLRVTPQQRYREVMPGWFFEIAKKPGPQQYRYLQFAWRKRDGAAVMVQLAVNGAWGQGRYSRFYAGENTAKWEADAVAKSLPGQWSVVTRDLFEDLGEGARLTGISFTVLGGEAADFDALYLARSRSDFAAIAKQGIALETARLAAAGAGSSDEKTPGGGGESVDVWINGALAYSGRGVALDYAPVETLAPLQSFFRPGANVVAVHAHSDVGEPTFDLGLRDALALVTVNGDPSKPSAGTRFAARLTFPRPAAHSIFARVRLALPAGNSDPAQSLDLYSDPLKIEIRNVMDAELLAYASDSARNLLRDGPASVKASSELTSWPASRAIDGSLALGWLCNDGDPNPSLTLTLVRATRANTLVFTHPQFGRVDGARSARIRHLALKFNGQEPSYVIGLDRDDERKTAWSLPSPVMVRSIELRVLERVGVKGSQDAVGLAEVELR